MTDLYDNHTFSDVKNEIIETDPYPRDDPLYASLDPMNVWHNDEAGERILNQSDELLKREHEESMKRLRQDLSDKFRQSLYETRKAHSYPGEGLSEGTIAILLFVLINGLTFGVYRLWKHFF
ncbi:hypothetical protein LVJ85_02375 [Neisseria sp. Dent CA1/247]|uniref:hypothetical protein n=1 Tax=Neisseria sp. Dent CA1/247 TaxID=2912675 RepID=UPI001FD3C83C|nr:hypothetical protein [Neisseria sp. Dent CA1/247]UOO77365.1 hypothetical protein LVJ85_02375 [Neisseria sp. Dent CA1/247]